MDETAILWLFGTIITVQLTVVGFMANVIWKHLEHCREVQLTLGKLSTLPDEIQRIRRHLHDMRNAELRRSGE